MCLCIPEDLQGQMHSSVICTTPQVGDSATPLPCLYGKFHALSGVLVNSLQLKGQVHITSH